MLSAKDICKRKKTSLEIKKDLIRSLAEITCKLIAGIFKIELFKNRFSHNNFNIITIKK